jgi:hypothetical protein
MLWLRHTVRHCWQTYEALIKPSPRVRMLWAFFLLWAIWHVYVPIHEMFHVFAALATGGTVTEIALEPQYGGTILAMWFPFVVSKEGYAGQLSGFEVPNDLAYLLVDFAPYVLSIPGVAAVELARRRQSMPWFSLGFLLCWTPFISVTGDFYEATSLGTTRIAAWLQPDGPVRVLVHDNVGLLWEELAESGHLTLTNQLLVLVGVLGGLGGALLTLFASHQAATWWFGAGWMDKALAEQRAERRRPAAKAKPSGDASA